MWQSLWPCKIIGDTAGIALAGDHKNLGANSTASVIIPSLYPYINSKGNKPMRFKIQLVLASDDDQPDSIQEIAVLDKDSQKIEHLGLTLAESKQILKRRQAHIVGEQVASFLDIRSGCQDCGRELRSKDHKTITFRTLFGTIALDSPRLRHCRCCPHKVATFSPLTALLPE